MPMKLVCFRHASEPISAGGRLGVRSEVGILDVTANARHEADLIDMMSLIRSGENGLRSVREMVRSAQSTDWLAPSEVKLLPPLLPSTILCSGSNYRDHNSEKAASPGSGREPEFFVKTSDCVIGPNDPIIRDPRTVTKLDCETELGVVIGRTGAHVPPERGLDLVFGYTVVNDVTARDKQVRKTASGDVWYDLGRGKVFDTSAPLGPCIVTADEIGDPQKLAIETRINGELRQSGRTQDMLWSCAQLISIFSSQLTLRPGMVIITGTPAGTAWSSDRELGGRPTSLPGLVPASRYCEPGDVIECHISGIGTLENRVAAPTSRTFTP